MGIRGGGALLLEKRGLERGNKRWGGGIIVMEKGARQGEGRDS